jgi:glycosyltransferase involved in cell wall biosynthesis
MSKPAITIITPTYNRATSLRRAIQSVQRQSCSDYEYLIVDDGSTDGTEEIVQSMADLRTRYLRLDRHQGANPARNAGIEAAQGDLLTFLDSDDEYLPERLSGILSITQKEPETELILSSFMTSKGATSHRSCNPSVFLSGPELELALMSHAIFIGGTSITVRKSTIQRSGGFEPTLQRLQDREALLRLSQHCGARLLAEVDWIKHVSPDSISLPRTGYVESISALLEVHPELSHQYDGLIRYHIARHVLSDLLRGRIGNVVSSMRANYESRKLNVSVMDLANGYRTGRDLRRSVVNSIRSASSRRAESH